MLVDGTRVCARPGCNTPLKSRAQKYCTAVCRDLAYKAHIAELGPLSLGQTAAQGVAGGTKGIAGEYLVVADLLLKGYEVFTAASRSCSCDLVVLKGDTCLRVEVRTGFHQAYQSYSRLGTGRDAGRQDLFAIVGPDRVVEYLLPGGEPADLLGGWTK